MNLPRDRGADPGPEDNKDASVQNDQPQDKNKKDDQVNTEEAILQSFYQLPDDVRQAINSLPEEQRTATINAFDKHRSEFEGGMQVRLKEGREAVDSITALMSDPRIRDIVNGVTTAVEQPQNPPANQNQPSTPGQFGEEGEAFMRAMSGMIKEDLGIDDLKSTVASMGTLFNKTTYDNEMENLKAWAEKENMPDPDIYRSTMSVIKNNNPNLTLDQVYKVALRTEDIPTRPSVNGPKLDEQNQDGTKIISTQLPGGSKSSAVARTATEDLDPVKVAIENHKKGIRLNIPQALKDGAAKAVQIYNELHGTNVNADDL